jgi:hypothetical protein
MVCWRTVERCPRLPSAADRGHPDLAHARLESEGLSFDRLPPLQTSRAGHLCEHTFVPIYPYLLTEHDEAKPWLITRQEHRTIELDDDVNFFAWANETWPPPRWRADLTPRPLTPWPT